MSDIPNIDQRDLPGIDKHKLLNPSVASHPPRILLLYGSLRERSYSKASSKAMDGLLGLTFR